MTSAPFRIALYEGTGSQAFEPATRLAMLTTLLEKGYSTTVVRPGGQVSTPTQGHLLVLGRFHEAKPARVDGDVTVFFRQADTLDATSVLPVVEEVRAEAGLPPAPKWKPWFPVIDYDRCTNCMQCLSFCLFDVYGVSDEKKIQVQNHNKCKTDCPACSRVCPEVAILFPKYRHGPINGDEVNSDDLRRETMKVDISALLGGDIYQALRDRSAKSKSRFSKERDEDKALEERKRCLIQLGKDLEIPAEVFASLPSIDQIKAKAEEASAKATAALAQVGSPS
ncbi:MAG: 4Fe-4S dicluster domain-containing protein [Fimbriiglobus sp.]